MPKPTKADLQAELALLGETAPAGWTKLELEQRLRELRELGVTDHENVRANTSMEKMMKDLRRASRLKSTLAKYCTETLQLELTGNEVMAKLIDKATKEIYRVCPAEGHDLVSFGKHADECYITLATEYPEYATWVKTTYKENGEEHVEPRLARLAKWLVDQDQKPLPKSKAMLRREQGYMKMRGPMTSTTQGGRTSGSRASTDPMPAQAMKMMGEMAEALESMRQELAEVKGQRPRKTAGKSDEGHLTDGSFSVLSNSPQKEHETMSASQRLSAQLKSQSTRALPVNRARALERPYLMECACEADSILSSTVQTVAKSEEAATRCALYNGCDLSCDAGVRLIMARIEAERPQHVWLSPPGSAFFPLQHSNQADKAQAEALKAKRREALKVFVGCTCVMHYAIQKGIHVTLEVADRSDAWRLPLLNQLQQKYNMFKAVASGCAFNLKEVASGRLVQRGWRVLTTHKRLATTLEEVHLAKEQLNQAETSARAHQQEKPRYLILGTYACGNHYGITKASTNQDISGLHGARWSCSMPGNGMLYKLGKDCGFQWQGLGVKEDVQAVFQRPAKKGIQLEEEIKRKLNVDPLVLRSEIYLDIIPGEAHWQIGTAENAIQGLKTVMTKLSSEDPSLTAEQAMSLAVSTFNHREMIRGFSPAQHVLGCAPDETGRHVFGNQQIRDDVILNQPLQDFRKETELRATAEKALVEWQAQQRLTRAANSRARPSHRYHPGDLVYFWRTQESGKGRRCPGTAQGRFLGPARILAMETRQSEEGEARPSHAIWVVRGRHLMKCSPEQLRPASQREELVESLATDDQTPWTYTRLAEEIGGTQYEDISEEVPTPNEWQRAQDQAEEVLPRRSRIRGKRPAPERGEDLDLEDSGNNEPGQPSVVRRRDQLPGNLSNETAAVAIELEMPNSNKGWDRFFNNPQAYFVGALKRRAVEVSEKRLSPEDRERFREAKNKEVRNFIGAKAFEALPEHLKPSKEQAIGMRWLLTWKAQEDGSVRPKARAILLGYQDPDYAFRSTTAPVMTRQTRQLFLQAAANHRWRIQKGDITGAFLQGREYPSELFCIPCDEILESMNLP
ncbi:RE1, partial [Symbiodinium sp. CCMP2456]